MSRVAMPSQFKAKTWIFGVQSLMLGGLAAFSLVLGPLFLFGLIKKADGRPGTEAGVALTLLSVPFLLAFALSVSQLRARRRPLIRLYREGIEVVVIGASMLDRIPLIPTVIRFSWLILTTQGFKTSIVRIPWQHLQNAWVSGLPMAHFLTITASPSIATAKELPPGSFVTDRVVLPDAMFIKPLDQIAAAIWSYAGDSMNSGQLPSWSDVESAHG